MALPTRSAVQSRLDGSARADAYIRDLVTLLASLTNDDNTPYAVRAVLGLADSLHAAGEATAPAAGAAICTLAAPPAGVYDVAVAAWVSAAAAADASNIELRRAGSALYTPLVVAVTHAFRRFRITLDGSQNLSVNAIAIGTAGVVYAAEINAVRVE